MSDFYHPSKIRTAKKDYHCIACQHISMSWNEPDILALPVDELITYQKAKANNFRIKAGDKYLCQTGVYDGQYYTYRAIPKMNDICHKYDLFPDD